MPHNNQFHATAAREPGRQYDRVEECIILGDLAAELPLLAELRPITGLQKTAVPTIRSHIFSSFPLSDSAH